MTDSFAIRNSSFDILTGPENADAFRRDLRADYVLGNGSM